MEFLCLLPRSLYPDPAEMHAKEIQELNKRCLLCEDTGLGSGMVRKKVLHVHGE